VRRRHLYHHSRHGALDGGRAYGITSDFWDKVFGTRIPLPERDRLGP
jgi:sterol desaturase/sphingolipid hydroxylase (fatty acid hydroxylase superfamily)